MKSAPLQLLSRTGAKAVAREFTKYDLLTYSSAMAFQVLYAVVPVTMLVLAGLGTIGEQSVFTRHVAPTLRHDLSHDAYEIANRTALHVMNDERAWWLTFGLVVTLWGVGAAVRSLMTPLNEIYGAREDRSWPHRLAVSVGGGAIAVVCVLAALLLTLGGRLVHPELGLGIAFAVGRWAVTLLLLGAAIASLLWFAPAKRRPLEWISVGSGLCMVCWVVATLGFGAYISSVSYSSFYGAVAGIVLLLIYLHLSAIAFLLGVVVDSLLREKADAKS
jgi:membrane protein